MTSVSKIRKRGQIDVTDLMIGLLLIVGLPVICYVAMKIINPPKAGPSLEPSQIKSPPDREEVRQRLDYLTNLYYKNAMSLLRDAKETEGTDQIHILIWAKLSLEMVRTQASDLRFVISDPGAQGEFRKELENISEIKQGAERGLEDVKSLDILGVTRAQ